MFKRILLPMDGSERAELTAKWSAGLAKALGASLTLLSVVEPDELKLPDRLAEGEYPHLQTLGKDAGWRGGVFNGPFGPMSAPPGHGASPVLAPATGTQVIDRATTLAARYLESQAKTLRPLAIEVRVNVGVAADEIIKVASEIRADVIAMPRHRSLGTAIGLIGSTTDKVLRTSPIPVLVTDPRTLKLAADQPACPDVVLVPLDRSPLSETAVEPARELAKACGSQLRFVHVIRDPALMATAWGSPYAFSMDAEMREATEYLEGLILKAKGEGIRAQSVALVGSPGLRIVDETGISGRALVVMTTHGKTGYRRLLLGSVTDKVVRSAGCPVLVLTTQGV